MELSLMLGKQIASMLLMGLTGFIAVRAKLLKAEDSRILSVLIMYLVSPFSIYHAFQMDFSMDKLSGLGLALAAAVLAHVVFFGLNRAIRPFTKELSIESASIMYPNSLNLVIPLVTATLGGEWVFYSTAFCALQTFLFWSHCVSLIRGDGVILWKKMLNFNILGTFLGLISFLTGFRLPGVFSTAVSGIASLIGPVSMLIAGMVLGGMDLKKTFGNSKAYVVSLERLLLYPLAVLLVFRLFSVTRFHPEGRNIILITMMSVSSCTASSVMQMANVYHKNEEYACVINIITLVLCVITMPVIIYLYQLLF